MEKEKSSNAEIKEASGDRTSDEGKDFVHQRARVVEIDLTS